MYMPANSFRKVILLKQLIFLYKVTVSILAATLKSIIMPSYSAKIHLHAANAEAYYILNNELKNRSFISENNSPATPDLPTESHPLQFIRQGNVIQEVVDHVLSAARKTGKEFSFTIIKNKN